MTPPAILIVDDDTDILELFTAMLRGLPNPILKASSGSAALCILQDTIPALMILDVAMAAPGGLDILRQARSDSRFDATKIIILTAVPGRVQRRDMEQADMLLSKPISARDLVQKVAQLLSGC
jgi:two-component system, OmpR family, phosphate regulon response regulator PhoB